MKDAKQIQISESMVGEGCSVFIIAEAGVNHNGDPQTARKLIDAAAAAGADAVKFQTFKTEKLVTLKAPKAEYQKTGAFPEDQYSMLKELELEESAFLELRDYSAQKGIMFLSTPFDPESASFLNEAGIPAFKIGSGDLTNHPLLAHVASFGKPVIISSGMADETDIENALTVLEKNGNPAVILLHCVTSYPAAFKQVHLRVIPALASRFKIPVGYSDHTLGIEIALAAVSLGACVLEKHFTLDRTLSGPDHSASLEPEELENMVSSIRHIESAMGISEKKPDEAELEIARVARKSLVSAVDIKAGTAVTEDMITVKRPGTGIPPGNADSIFGRTAVSDIPADTVLTEEMFQ